MRVILSILKNAYSLHILLYSYCSIVYNDSLAVNQWNGPAVDIPLLSFHWCRKGKFRFVADLIFPLLSRTYYRRYSPSSVYPADTRMLWRIEYVINSGALIPSPVWGFQTRAFPDFKVEQVLVPPNAFSGQTFEVSWTVRNIGKVGNVLTTWYDAVFIGKSTEIRSARLGHNLGRTK